jgi:hypothetical protein
MKLYDAPQSATAPVLTEGVTIVPEHSEWEESRYYDYQDSGVTDH